ncbi:glycosyltransferase family 2 protein [Coraliomargarita sinensis]|uniref:Glycosyltransferase family 2 protein n=1 Tax=Coraliomargarita sinensis TaxID=2174842 RepID=A0A317ZJ45_9BACT|nr:glycosyltransferase family 2 protein [Coraliomargarita sinensis]PXA03799.1 glycosyltransferase family 2 protein [Coraliomargarita sinensis]
MPITIIIPVKNEAGNLPECLSRLEDFEHVVVVDSGSTDETVAIAEKAGAEVLHFQWDGRFPKKRNWVLRNYDFKTDWVLFLDADEFVTPRFVEELRAALADGSKVGYWLNYERWFLGKQLRYGDEFQKLALFRVDAGEYERIEELNWSALDMEIHEHPVVDGEVGEIKAPIEHNEYRGLRHYIAKHNEYSSWEANRYLRLSGYEGGKVESGKFKPTSLGDAESRGRRFGGSEWEKLTERQKKKYRHLTKWWAAPVYFLRGYFWKRGFLDGAAGFHFAFLKAVYFYQIRLKIKERLGGGSGFSAIRRDK